MLRIRVDDQSEAVHRSTSSGWSATTIRRQQCGPETSAPSQRRGTRTSPTDLLSVTALSNALLTLHRVACGTRIMSLLAATAVFDARQIILGRVEGVELR